MSCASLFTAWRPWGRVITGSLCEDLPTWNGNYQKCQGVFLDSGCTQDLHGSFTATIIFWPKRTYLCGLQSLMVMTLPFFPSLPQKLLWWTPPTCNLLLKNSFLCLKDFVLIIMNMSSLKCGLVSGFQLCFQTIWVTIIFVENFSWQNQTAPESWICHLYDPSFSKWCMKYWLLPLKRHCVCLCNYMLDRTLHVTCLQYMVKVCVCYGNSNGGLWAMLLMCRMLKACTCNHIYAAMLES